MKYIFLFATLIFSVSSLAQTQFEILKDNFARGSDVEIENIKGVYSGRCYDKINQSSPRATVLGAIPDFATYSWETPYDKIIEANRMFSDPAHYDSIDFRIAYIHIHVEGNHFSEAKIESGTLTNKTDGPSKSTLLVRKFNEHLILKWISGATTEVSVRSGQKIKIIKGEVWEACYYFKKLTK